MEPIVLDRESLTRVAALLDEVTRLLGVPKEAAPAVPDRTGESYCNEVGDVWRISAPPVGGSHPQEWLLHEGVVLRTPRPLLCNWSEHCISSDGMARVPPMPACPEDKELTGIVMCPQKGDRIVRGCDEYGTREFVELGHDFEPHSCEGNPYGTRRWGWKLKEVLSPDRVGQWLVSPNGLPFGPIHHSESGVHYLLPGNHGRHLHEGDIGPGKFEPALNTVRMTDKQYCEWKTSEREREKGAER